MKPYGSKRNDWIYHWTGKEEVIVYGNKTSPRRARQEQKQIISERLDEIEEDKDISMIEELERLYD